MIQIEKESDFFITSDTWFGRNQIIQISKRSFSSVDEMNETLIENWNNKIKENDTVIHLGNFAWDPHTAKKILDRLNGKIYFFIGHEDHSLLDVIKDNSNRYKNVSIISDQIYHLRDHDMVLSHYPLYAWSGKDTGTIHIHGHLPFTHKTELFGIGNRVNACIDQWNLSPIKISTIREFLNERKTKNVPPISQ